MNGLVVWTVLYLCPMVLGHGRLVEPPSRATMWRYGFKNPENYNDNQLYCGGITRQWSKNKGKCGVCGDPWDMKEPRPNEAGGKFGNGVIVRNYSEGQDVVMGVQLTANHKGYFEFRLCRTDNPKVVATDECLEQNILELSDGSGPRYYPGPGNKIFEATYRLPSGLTCSQCVLQWRYVAGNNWGMCENGTGMLGCGKQEQFRACADISILSSGGFIRPTLPPVTTIRTVTTESTDKTYVITIVNTTDNVYTEVDIVEEFMYGGLIAVAVLSFFLTIFFFVSLFLYYYEGGKFIKGALVKCRRHTEEKRPPLPPPPMHLDPSMKEESYYSLPHCDKTKEPIYDGPYSSVYSGPIYESHQTDHFYEEPFLCRNSQPKNHIYDQPPEEGLFEGHGSLSRIHLVTVNGIAI